MSKFTDYFNDFLDREVDSVASICKYSGVERTTIQKLKTGKRHPPIQTLDTFLSHTKISATEKAELLNLYEIELIGEDVYLSRKYVRELFNKFALIKNESLEINNLFSNYKVTESISFTGTKVINGAFYVNIAVKNWIIKAIEGEKDMNLFLPFSYKYFFDNLAYSYFSCQHKITINHILNFEKNTKKVENATKNLETLSNTLNFLLMKKTGYEPYYFYGSSNDSIDNFTPLPFYCCTDKEVIVFAANFENCFFSDQQDIVQFYTQHFKKTLINTKSLVTKTTSPNNSIMNYLSAIENADYLYATLEAQPCFGKMITKELIEKYLSPDLPERETVSEILSRAYDNARKSDKKFYSFFSEKGLYKFASDGIISYFPPNSSLPLDLQDRILFMQEVKNYIISNDNLFYIVRGEHLTISDNGSCEIMENGNIVFTSQYEDQSSIILLNEPSLYEAILDFFQNLSVSKAVYSKEESIKLIDDCIQYAKSKNK